LVKVETLEAASPRGKPELAPIPEPAAAAEAPTTTPTSGGMVVPDIGAAFNQMGDMTRKLFEQTFAVFSFMPQGNKSAPAAEKSAEAAPAEAEAPPTPTGEATPPAVTAGAGQL
jgi:hypothetical protein